jgi:hypothetical protein
MTLGGDGELVGSDTGPNWVYEVNGNAVLRNGAQHTIRGAMNLGFNNLEIINLGSIVADGAVAMSIDPQDSGIGFDNQGVLAVTGGGGMTIHGGAFTTSGQVTVDAGRTLTRNGHYPQTAGKTTVNGTLTLNSSGQLQLQGGSLRGTGVVTGPVVNSGGFVRPGTSAGTLTVNGAYTQQASGGLVIELGGSGAGQFDQLVVNGAATLAGELRVLPINGYVPPAGTQFTIVTSSPTAITGTFGQVTGPGQYNVAYGANAVTITVVVPPRPADVNEDGVVGVADLLAVISAWGMCPKNSLCPADIDGDGVVGVADLLAVISNWG